MGYLLLLVSAVMWSFVGIMVKAASGMIGSSVITLCRFLFGVLFLGVFILIKDRKIDFRVKNKWIWLGAIGKCGNYVFENIALTMGAAYGNVIVSPIQAIFLFFVAVFVFKEEIYPLKITAVMLCVGGVMLVSWKGMPLSAFLGQGLLTTIFFVLAAIGAGVHIISQKKLMSFMDSGNMNFSVFLLCTVVSAVPVPVTFRYTGHLTFWPLFSLVGLGLVTGISFYIYAEALKKVPFLVAAVVGNSSVLFSLLWARIFFHEGINGYIIAGTVLLLMGVLLINVPKGRVLGAKFEDKRAGQCKLSSPKNRD